MDKKFINALRFYFKELRKVDSNKIYLDGCIVGFCDCLECMGVINHVERLKITSRSLSIAYKK